MNKKAVKIIVPLLIVAALGGLWLTKNSDGKITEDKTAPIVQAASLPEHLKDADFSLAATKSIDFAALAKYNLPVIADYGADYCPPCRIMKPDFKAVHEEMVGKAFLKYVDVELNPEAADGLPIRVIPTQILFNADGSPYTPSDSIAKDLQFTAYNDKSTGKHVLTIHEGILTQEQMRRILSEMGVK